jgi:hypothetical protein
VISSKFRTIELLDNIETFQILDCIHNAHPSEPKKLHGQAKLFLSSLEILSCFP